MEDLYIQADATRRLVKRVDDLEHDNNTMRRYLADVQTENLRLSQEFEAIEKSCRRLIAKVDEFVNRFGVVQ